MELQVYLDHRESVEDQETKVRILINSDLITRDREFMIYKSTKRGLKTQNKITNVYCT